MDRFIIAGYAVYLAGGMSWGDDPSEAFTTLSDASGFPVALAAAGFADGDGG